MHLCGLLRRNCNSSALLNRYMQNPFIIACGDGFCTLESRSYGPRSCAQTWAELLLAIPYGEEAVCDDNTGPILHNTLYGLFRSGIHA